MKKLHLGTSINLLHGKFSMPYITCFVNKPCKTSSITAVCCLAADARHKRKLARVPVYREPHLILTAILAAVLLCSCGKNVPPDVAGDGREIIYLASVTGGTELEKQISDFNSHSSEYYIKHKKYYLGTVRLEYHATVEGVDNIVRQVETVSASSYIGGTAIGDIINEELENYYNGSKSSSEVCGFIQNRVSLYLEENYG